MLTENQAEKVYERKMNEWFFESPEDEAMKVETFFYENGAVEKRTQLSDGRTAVCHRLKGKDMVIVKRASGNDKDKFESALVAVCVKIDDKGIVLEDLDNMWFNDVMTLQAMTVSLNFL